SPRPSPTRRTTSRPPSTRALSRSCGAPRSSRRWPRSRPRRASSSSARVTSSPTGRTTPRAAPCSTARSGCGTRGRRSRRPGSRRPMKLRDVQARALIAPLDPPVRTASGHVSQAPILLIDLVTDAGVIGRSYLFGYHAFTLRPLRELVLALGQLVAGDELAPLEIERKLRARMALFGARGLQGMAVAGIDMAAWDAI